jgi:chaperonin GroEL
VVPGGGVAYIRSAKRVDTIRLSDPDEMTGVRIIKSALDKPLFYIAANAGAEGATVVERVKSKKGNYGYNAYSGVFEDLVAKGIIDPTKVARIALQNAASVAGLLLTTEAAITECPDKEPNNHMIQQEF